MRAVVFDLDGVLADTEHLWEESWQKVGSDLGVAWSADDTRTVQGMSSREWSGYLATRAGADPDEVRERCIAYFEQQAIEGRADPMPGGPELVVAAAERVPVALASSAPRRAIDSCITRFGLTDCFRATVSSDEVDRGKPFPDVYLAAVDRLGVAAPESFGIEDSGNGIKAAWAAGLAVVAVPNHRYPPAPEALALAAHVASDVAAAGRHVLARLDAGASGT